MASDQDPDYFVSLHSPDGTEIDVGEYERQPIHMIPNPESESDAEPGLINGSRVEFPLFDSRATIDRVGLWDDDELLTIVPLYREFTVPPDMVTKIEDGQLLIDRDELPSEMEV